MADAALKLEVESLDEIDEPFRSAYEEKDGKFRLRLDGAEPVEDVKGLKSALERERADRKKFAALAKKFEGVDLERYEELQKKAQDAEEREAEKKGQWESLKTQLIEKHGKDIEPLQSRIGSLTKSLEKAMIDAEATRAVAKLDGSTKLLLPHIRSRVRLVEENGQHVVVVVGDDGEPRVGNGKGDPMTIEDLVKEMRDDPEFGGAFKANGAAGGGSTGRHAAGGGGQVRTKADLGTPADKAHFIRDNGEEAFYALPDK